MENRNYYFLRRDDLIHIKSTIALKMRHDMFWMERNEPNKLNILVFLYNGMATIGKNLLVQVFEDGSYRRIY